VSDDPLLAEEEEELAISPRAIRAFAVIFYALLGAAGLLWTRQRTGAWLPASVTGGDAVASLLYGICLAALVITATGPMIRWLPWMRWLSLEMRRLLGPIDLRTALVVAVASGIGEEVFFRGALLPVAGLTVSSLIFAAVHTGPDRRYLAWTAFSLAIGFALGGITVATGSLVGAAVAHILINAVNLRRIGRLRIAAVDNPETRASVPE
jgi:hypothetical protein